MAKGTRKGAKAPARGEESDAWSMTREEADRFWRLAAPLATLLAPSGTPLAVLADEWRTGVTLAAPPADDAAHLIAALLEAAAALERAQRPDCPRWARERAVRLAQLARPLHVELGGFSPRGPATGRQRSEGIRAFFWYVVDLAAGWQAAGATGEVKPLADAMSEDSFHVQGPLRVARLIAPTPPEESRRGGAAGPLVSEAQFSLLLNLAASADTDGLYFRSVHVDGGLERMAATVGALNSGLGPARLTAKILAIHGWDLDADQQAIRNALEHESIPLDPR